MADPTLTLSSAAPSPTLLPAPLPAEVLDQLELAYVLTDREGIVLSVNNFFLRLSGYERAEVLGRPYHQVFALPADRAARLRTYQRSIADEHLPEPYDRPLLTRDGHLCVVQWTPGFVRDATGRVTGAYRVGRELADRSQATQLLTAGDHSYLQDFLDNAQDLVLQLSAESNNFLFINRAAKDKLGYSDQELASRTIADVVHPYYRAKLLYQLRQLGEGEPVNKVETVLLTRLGRPVHLLGSLTPTVEGGQLRGVRAVLHDITDRIKAERLQKVYYSIANLAISAKDSAALYKAIHRELSRVLNTNSFIIALCDDERTQLEFVYAVDDMQLVPAGTVPYSTGLVEYVINSGEPQMLTRAQQQALVSRGELTAFGPLPAMSLCAPLRVGERIIGVMGVRSYDQPDAYEPADLEVLYFISSQVALAIERKQQETRLQQQSARLNAIFESGTHLMWTVDVKGKLLNFNRNYAAFFLRRNGTYPYPGMSLWQADLARMEAGARETFVRFYQAAIAGQTQRFEVWLRDASGKNTWADIHLNPIRHEDGSLVEISAIAHDITEQKRTQLALQAQEEKFRSIFESFQDIYYRTDDQGLLTIVSPSVREVLGYEPTEVMGRPVVDYYCDPEDRHALMAEVTRTGGLRNYETRMRHKDGHAVSVLVNARVAASGVKGTEGIARDISEMRQMQDELRQAKDAAEAALAAKSQFLANMSHELRTPMNGIIGMIDLLDQTVTGEEQLDYVDTLRKSSDALLTILNDILDLSKIQAGKLRLQEAPVALESVLNRIRALFSYRAEQKRLRFTYHITPHTPVFVVTDEMRLLQILSNLVSNAIKFTNRGTVSIVVSSVSTDGEHHTLRFAVQDSGIGIAANAAAQLFNAFTQLDNSLSKSYGGTGLGLSISKQLAELLGGEIGVLSNAGDGSVFWFTIRCRSAESSGPVTDDADATADEVAGRLAFRQPPRILLVDDNAINRKVGQRLLSKLGCDVDRASSGLSAVTRATAPGPGYDLIFMDIQMPEMDGVAATKALRERLGAACPPIVAMTAYSMEEDAQRFVDQGLDDYIAKPVRSEGLQDMLVRWLPQLLAESAPAEVEAEVELAAPAAEPAASAKFPTPPAAPELSPPDPAQPLLNPETLQQLRELGGPEFAAQLYEEFEAEAGQLMEQATAALDAADHAALLPLLHQLKGTSATLGLAAIAEQARSLEQRLKHGRLENIEPGFQLLTHYFAQFTADYPALVAPAG
ncbi:PAS domain S-box protein [uncultured Hymenobacter sp.]|uniref:PAS domain S-box protein n=1 Tax=uncultured Hymenobacter sp. TaxID=170016 RepID=UPI0035C9840E